MTRTFPSCTRSERLVAADARPVDPGSCVGVRAVATAGGGSRAAGKGATEVRERRNAGRALGSLGGEWVAGVLDPVILGARSIIGSRGGSGKAYERNTARPYKRDWENLLKPEFGERIAGEIEAEEWQEFVDSLAADSLSRSRVDSITAVASAIYEWASHPTTRRSTGCKVNPIRLVRKPARDAKPRTRVALPPEAKKLLAALSLGHRVPYGLAFYAGMRREEIERLLLADVDMKARRITFRKAKSEAGTLRRLPIIKPLYVILAEADLAREPGAKTPESKGLHTLADVRQARCPGAQGVDRREAQAHPPARVPPHLRVVPDGGRLPVAPHDASPRPRRRQDDDALRPHRRRG
jgi:hypothetical protein